MKFQEEYVTIDVNRGMLRHCSPLRNLIYGALFYLLILLVAPVTLNVDFDFSSMLYVLLCCIAFILGCASVPISVSSEETLVRYSGAQIRRFVKILFVLSVIATLTKFYDTFFIRDISISQNVFENRDSSGMGSGNPIAIVAAFLMYTPYILLAVEFCFSKYFLGYERVTIWFLFGTQFLYPFLMGSRSGLLFPLVFLVLLLLYFRKIRLRFNLKTLTIMLACFVIGSTLSGKLYSDRVIQVNPLAVLADLGRETGAAATVPSNDTVYELIRTADNDSWTSYFLVGYVNFCQYYLHGLFEFPIQKGYVDSVLITHTYGAYMFGIYAKFFDRLFGTDSSSVRIIAFIRPGIFNSVFGPTYTDFGWFGLIVMFFWGLIQKLIWRVVYRTGNLILLPWVFLGGMVIFLFPLLNLFPGPLCYAFTFIIVMHFLFPMRDTLEVRKNAGPEGVQQQ